MITFRCDKCGRELRVKDELRGKRGKCPCGNALTVPVGVAESLSSLPLLEEAPAKRPVCGTLALIFGSAALGLGLLGSLLYIAFWLSLDDLEKFSVIIGTTSNHPGTGKLLLGHAKHWIEQVCYLLGEIV
jgi:hypothetical protein